MDSLFCFIQLFLGRPWLSFITGAGFLLLGYLLIRRAAVQGGVYVGCTGAAWTFFGLYESMLMTMFRLTPGAGTFRFDAVFLSPFLGIMTLISLCLAGSGLRGSF